MLITVIIPTCNRNDHLSICLNQLAPWVQTITDDYEVFVTDDSNENIAKELIEKNYKWVKWIEGYKKGPAANRNNGARHASGDWLIFIDDDCLPDKNLLAFYKIAIEYYPESLAFEGAILPDDWALLQKDMAECPVNTTGNCFWSANICVQRRLFINLNGFDELFLIAAQEDQDLFERLKKITSVRFVEQCIVLHPVRFVKLRKKLALVSVSIENWYLFVKKEKSFSSCLAIGLKSQIKAIVNNIKAKKIKNTIYHIYTLMVFLPIMIRFKIIKNE